MELRLSNEPGVENELTVKSRRLTLRSFVMSFIVAMLLATIFSLVNYFWIVPGLYGLKNSFRYQADVLSLDNFFDESAGRFTGESRSVTTFGYRNVNQADKGVVINTFFDVRTVDGDQVINVEREYGIDPITWEHILDTGDRDRSGNLFAPTHLQKGESFSYWHVNYDTELHLEYEATESINGLPVYRYGSSFQVDQSENLTHLAGVPDERGVDLDVSLTMWVEPVSGWLVKYEDSAIAYYYDVESGARLHPWNKFSNRYRLTSIQEQSQVAAQRRAGMLMLQWVLPLLLFFGVLTFMTWRFRKRTGIRILVVGLILVLGFGVWSVYPLLGVRQPDKILIGIAHWAATGNALYEENIQGFKDALENAGYAEGKHVLYDLQIANSDTQTQRHIADLFSQENVALVFSQTTPGTQILHNLIPHRPIVFSIVTYPVEAGLIESSQNSGNNLVGTRNWVPVEDQLSTFLRLVPDTSTIGFVHREGEVNSSIQLNEMRTAAEALGIEIEAISGVDLLSLKRALDETTGIDALYSSCDTLVQSEAEEVIISFAHARALPSFSCSASGPQKGDLMGVVSDFYRLGQLSGEQAILILEGATPSSLETVTEAQPQFHLNLSTAELLDIEIPQDVLVMVDKIIK